MNNEGKNNYWFVWTYFLFLGPKQASSINTPRHGAPTNPKTPGLNRQRPNFTAAGTPSNSSAMTPRPFPGSAKTPASGFIARSRFGGATPLTSSILGKRRGNGAVSNSNIKVAVRCRPMLPAELDNAEYPEPVVQFTEDQVIYVVYWNISFIISDFYSSIVEYTYERWIKKVSNSIYYRAIQYYIFND